MKYDFEEFTDGPPPLTDGVIHVTINARCLMFFNRKALEALGSPDGVTLMYDRRRSVIGVKASPLSFEKTFILREKNPACARGRIISAKAFCRKFHIRPDETLAFVDPKLQDGILILDLNEVRSVKKK